MMIMLRSWGTKAGILNNLNGDWLFNRFRDFYGDIYGLSYSEVEEIYNAQQFTTYLKQVV